MAATTSGTATTTAERATTAEGAVGRAQGPVTAGLRAQDGGITVPVPTVGVRLMHLPAPGAVMATAMNSAAGVTDVVRDRVPNAQQLLYYGGLGAMAAFGVLSWPAAAAIGVGVWVAERARGAGRPAMSNVRPAMNNEPTRQAAREGEKVGDPPAAMGGEPADRTPAPADATRRREPLP